MGLPPSPISIAHLSSPFQPQECVSFLQPQQCVATPSPTSVTRVFPGSPNISSVSHFTAGSYPARPHKVALRLGTSAGRLRRRSLPACRRSGGVIGPSSLLCAWLGRQFVVCPCFSLSGASMHICFFPAEHMSLRAVIFTLGADNPIWAPPSSPPPLPPIRIIYHPRRRFGITGSSSMYFVRPVINDVFGMDGEPCARQSASQQTIPATRSTSVAP